LDSFRKEIAAAIPALRRYARALTRSAENADDLVQDTLLRALRSQHLFHGGDMRSWLYTILTNLNRNRLRSLARRPTVVTLEENDAADMAVRRPLRATSSGRLPPWSRSNAQRCSWSCSRAFPIAKSPQCRGCRSVPSCRDWRALARRSRLASTARVQRFAESNSQGIK
jgi:Sigma-70 region 2